ncbi:glycerol acyltransferase [Rhizobium sp. SEMIA 4085]|uniref:Phospholipid/glycerol acyltransferase protein n=1 Tax=Rhizobium gallicum bv. gallicum R602sp TaxID=1041138 RepID=A0A0B4X2E1_9HYPH|nr:MULTISPECIES: lysophospholipid acyltransferase family protein [Rhizobium]AJD41326.1 phospholipid/glycerol acyltransferase protein [Rhizobium gallicum bv. gallicum R602sp]NNH33394.1 glycerol acyltransferase [Rhizobium sp. SEMIA 4085]
MRFKQLSYASESDPRLKRWLIRSIEGLSGRDRHVQLYDIWRRDIVPTREGVFGKLLDLLDVRFVINGAWPPQLTADRPLVIVANHPFGIGDGIAVLALAEQLGRSFRVLVHNELLKVPEMAAYSLPVSFDETKEAVGLNMETRREAVRLLKDGVVVIIFPAGGVATAKNGFGRAEDLPWKIFPAKLVQAAGASVLPIYFEGQNGRLFHIVSRFSLTLRLSLLIREFRRLSGKTIIAHAGPVLPYEKLRRNDRKALLAALYDAVFSLGSDIKRKRI